MRLIDADEIRIKPEYMHDICGLAMIRIEDVARIINEMPTINPQPRWTPCSEKLPEEDKQEYLVTVKALKRNWLDMASFTTDLYSVNKYDFYDKKGKSGWYFFNSELGFLELHDVIAWMPLPKPYMREGEELLKKMRDAE